MLKSIYQLSSWLEMNSSFTLQHFMWHKTHLIFSPLGLFLSFRSFWKEKILFHYKANGCWFPLSNSSLWRRRERALCTRLTFLCSLTIGALKAFHLWSFCGKIRELGLISLPVQYIYISATIKAGQYAIPMYFSLWALPPHYNFHRHFVCKCSNRHIYHIKRDSIFFSIIHRYE